MSENDNPLLDLSFPIPFQRMRAEHVVPGIRSLLDEARAQVEELGAREGPPTWDSVLAPLDQLIERVGRATTGTREAWPQRVGWLLLLHRKVLRASPADAAEAAGEGFGCDPSR